MLALLKRAFIAALFLCVVAAANAADGTDWKRFDGGTSFSALYPTSWVTVAASTDRLRILTSNEENAGSLIGDGQAEIIVMVARGSVNATLAQLADQYAQDEFILSRRDIRNDKGDKQGCQNLREVTSKERMDSGSYIVTTRIFCEVNGDRFVTTLRNWQGDKHQAEYRRTALRIAKSLQASSAAKWNLSLNSA